MLIVSSSAAAIKKPRRKYRITEADRARRAAQIIPFASAGGKSRNANVPKEVQREISSRGGKSRCANYERLKSLMKPESPEELRKRRMELEGKREQILDSLTKAALGQQAPDADCSIISAALRELRTESDRLLEREERAKAEAAVKGGDSPRAPIVQPSPGNPAPENPATENPPAVSPD